MLKAEGGTPRWRWFCECGRGYVEEEFRCMFCGEDQGHAWCRRALIGGRSAPEPKELHHSLHYLEGLPHRPLLRVARRICEIWEEISQLPVVRRTRSGARQRKVLKLWGQYAAHEVERRDLMVALDAMMLGDYESVERIVQAVEAEDREREKLNEVRRQMALADGAYLRAGVLSPGEIEVRFEATLPLAVDTVNITGTVDVDGACEDSKLVK